MSDRPYYEHAPHCQAMNGEWVCNRDFGHDGAHESRSDRNGGCRGWAPTPDEVRFVRDVDVPTAILAAIEQVGKSH